MSDEAFPNAEQLFHDAYALSDPAPKLLDLIKAHPTHSAVVDLLVYYTDVVEQNPYRANELASALVSVRDSPDAPKIHDSSLAEVFSRQLGDLHVRGFELDNNFGPTNSYLITSLLSGLSFKYNLTTSPDQYGNIQDGLDAHNSQVLVIGACIQLLTNGSRIIPSATSYIQSADQVVTKLKAQQSAGTVKDSNALKILQRTISHAETGFKKENDVDNVWELLFPSKS